MFSTLLLLLTTLACVSAFRFPTGNNRQSPKLSMSTVNEFSKSVPFLKKPQNLDGWVGNVEFDPLGFAEKNDIRWMREAELKHGRIAMLATVGWLFQQYGPHLPSPGGTYDVSNPIDALVHVGFSPSLQIFLFIGTLESINHNGKLSMLDMFDYSMEGPEAKQREVGEFSLPIYGASQLKGKSPAQVADLKLKELKNGRLAMLAIGGLVHHQIIQGSELLGAFPNPNLWDI